jgi:hypothetical protein
MSDAMANEDIIVPVGKFARDPSSNDFEEILAELVLIAQGQGKNFLSYLLIMALMHVREESEGRGHASH